MVLTGLIANPAPWVKPVEAALFSWDGLKDIAVLLVLSLVSLMPYVRSRHLLRSVRGSGSSSSLMLLAIAAASEKQSLACL